jgi:hypothetical protein
MMAELAAKQLESARRLRANYFAVLLLLVVQYLLGMAVNLFLTIPRNHPGANPPEYFSGVAQSVTWAILHGAPLLQLHALFGLLIAIYAVGLLRRGIQSRTKSLMLPAIFGALGIVAAGLNGGSFLNYNEDFSSMIMASSFAVAVVSYLFGLFLTRGSPTG